MARETHAKEDWIAEATGIPFRAEFEVVGFDQPVVWGYRAPPEDASLRIGAASFLIGDEPIFQWNSKLELRRAFSDGRMVKAGDGRLIALKKERRNRHVQMIRDEFDDLKQSSFLRRLRALLDKFEIGFARGTTRVVREATPNGEAVDMSAQARLWLAALPVPLTIAAVPNVS